MARKSQSFLAKIVTIRYNTNIGYEHERGKQVAITDRIRAEARRTIDGIKLYYEKYGQDLEDAEEKEHRIARIEAAMEGCNGLSQEDKVQKTAENLFELTCAQERAFDSMRKEIKLLRDENTQEFDILRRELKSGLNDVMNKIEDSGSDSSGKNTPSLASPPASGSLQNHFISKLISEHPLISLNAFLFVLLLVFISGHFDELAKLISPQ